MKRYIEINGDIVLNRYNSEWEFIIEITPKDIVKCFFEIQLLLFKHIESIKLKSLKTNNEVYIENNKADNESKITVVDNSYKVKLTNNDLEVISSYILKYYRDSYAPVNHIHIDLANNNVLGENGSLTVVASVAAEPISGEEAKKLLGLK